MAKNQKQQQKRQQAAKQRREKRKGGKSGPDPKRPTTMRLEPSDPTQCYPPVYITAKGQVIPDPAATLGLGAGERDEAAIRAAWRQKMLAFPPEQHPELAAQLTEARDRLLNPERALERALGVLRVPRPEAFGLTAAPPSNTVVDVTARLLAQSVLYALVEEELQGEALLKRLARR